MNGRHIAATVGAALTVLLSCSGEASSPAAPAPDEAHAGPGGLVSASELDAPDLDGTIWRMTYRSESVSGVEIEVTGLVAQPSSSPPERGYPILSWAHGTTGVADACAPSASGADGVPMLQELLDAGYVVAATDYEGLGTPGVHPYLVSVSEGRSVVDAARAARQVVGGVGEQLVVAGHSQGGHAALAAAEIAAVWAPELDLVGTVAGAPVTDLRAMVPGMFSVPVAQGFAVLIATAWADAYPDLEVADVLGTDGLEIAAAAADGTCVADLFVAVADAAHVVAAQPADLPRWQERVEENSIDPRGVAGPVLIVQGTEDVIIARGFTDRFVDDLCAAGADLVYRTYEGEDHGSLFDVALDDVRGWLEDRLDGDPVDTTCT